MERSAVELSPGVLTVGHSSHTLKHLLWLLKTHGVTAVADVRSSPYSRLHPQFNREELDESLEQSGIKYIFFGKELGARPQDPSCYEQGRVQYRLLAGKPLFRRGLDRIVQIADKERLALLCAERDPLACHRSILISRELQRWGINAAHIHSDATIEHQSNAVERLLKMLDMLNFDMFKPSEEITDEAFAAQEKRIAYRNEGVIATAAIE